MKSTPKLSFITTTTNNKPRFHYHQHHQQPHKKSKRRHRKPTTKSHIAEEEEEEHRAKRTEANKWSSDPPISRSRGPRVSQSGLGSVRHRFSNPLSPTKLPISRSTCLTIWPGLSPTLFLESPITNKASNLEVHVSQDPTWAQSNIVSRIPCSPFQDESLVLLSL